jgi:KipI family sensor histidine kinase inhibitor
MGGIAEEKKRIVEIPVCYGGEFGPDLEHCAELEHTTPEEIIRKHTQHDHYVYMLGFAPGQPYSARFEEPYGFKRRETARLSAPAGSAVVQQDLSDIIPFDQPCGWNIIGRTPCEICDYTREEPFLLRAGDWIRHRSVSPEEYREIRRQVRAKEWKPVVIE